MEAGTASSGSGHADQGAAPTDPNAAAAPAAPQPGAATGAGGAIESQTVTPAADGILSEGDHCPLCHVGILFRVSENDDGPTLHCFACNRSQSYPNEGSIQSSAEGPSNASTGHVVTAAQSQAMTDAGAGR